jgi:hypothetical protein
MNQSSLLTLSECGVPLYAARGLTQSLDNIEAAAQLERSINGELMDFSYAQFRKFRSTISCTDQRPPSHVWQGQILTVECVEWLAYRTSDGAPIRPVVPGSTIVEGEITFYRPILTMRVAMLSHSVEEWAAGVSWQLELEEV